MLKITHYLQKSSLSNVLAEFSVNQVKIKCFAIEVIYGVFTKE